jgi:hypothetical protein
MHTRRPFLETRRRAGILTLLFLTTGCGDDPVAPVGPEDFYLGLRNLIEQTTSGDRITPEFEVVATWDVEVDGIEQVVVRWPGGVAETSATSPSFDTRGSGRFTTIVDTEHPSALLPGPYRASVRFDDGRQVTFERDSDLVLLEPITDVTPILEAGSAGLEWQSPAQLHRWSLDLYAVVGSGEEERLERVVDGPSGAAQSASISASTDFGDGIAPGQPYVVRLTLENEHNVRVYEVEAVRPD